MKGIWVFFTMLILSLSVIAQDTISGKIYTRYLFSDSTVSSEGYLRDGKPDGYWKTYYENGNLKAEGNRKNFLIDGTWKFYNEHGELGVSIDYVNSLKHGKRVTYLGAETIEENFIDDVKQGWSYIFYPGGQMKQKVFFTDGREQGMAYEYETDGTVISLSEWRNGFVVNRVQVNRRDGMGRKQGVWTEFYPSGSVKQEGTFRNDLRNGYFKEYDQDGNLLNVYKYVNGELIKDAAEVAVHDIRTDYYPDGKVKIVGTYKEGKPHGVRKEYAPDGKLTIVYIFNNGDLMGMGLMDEQGRKQGLWKEYYNTGQVMAEGTYNANIRAGKWMFYYRNGRLEQQGFYNAKGKPEGKWEWFYPTGSLQRVEEYAEGMLNGMMEEYDTKGNIIAKGLYEDGLEEGQWLISVNDHREKGEYVAGAREGEWKSSYPEGTVYFTGKYVADLPNGKHTWYWDNGNKKAEGVYVMGVSEGDWRRYDYEGVLVLQVTFRNGIEIKYEGVRIEPAIETDGME